MIGNRLKLARINTGLSLRDLSARMGHRVSAQALGKYERDEMMPGAEVLQALSKALDVPEGYLQSTGQGALGSVEFRKKAASGAREEATLKAKVLEAVERYLEVEDVLAVSSTQWHPPAGFPYEVSTLEAAEVAAEMLRERWNLGQAPIPILSDLLEERGIKVLVLPLPENFSGLLAKVQRSRGGYVYVIVVNQTHHGERQRFTLAHELGHLVLKIASAVDTEKACHRFASAFLIPSFVLRAEVGRYRKQLAFVELLQLKRLWGVSMQAIVYRLKDLQIISETSYRLLFQKMSRLGWRGIQGEPGKLPSEKAARFERLCFRALSEELISENRVSELLGISLRELQRRFTDSGRAARAKS